MNLIMSNLRYDWCAYDRKFDNLKGSFEDLLVWCYDNGTTCNTNDAKTVVDEDEIREWIKSEALKFDMINDALICIKKENETMNKTTNNSTLTIINYMYDEMQNSTILTWSDGTKTTAKCEDDTEPSRYIGFMVCVAKKFMPNATSLANEWLVKKPKREAEAKAKIEAEKAEAERIAAKKAESAKQWHLRKQAGMIAEAYKNQQEIDEIKRIAVERYNVPTDFIEKFFE